MVAVVGWCMRYVRLSSAKETENLCATVFYTIFELKVSEQILNTNNVLTLLLVRI